LKAFTCVGTIGPLESMVVIISILRSVSCIFEVTHHPSLLQTLM
jgi:hypothetical protein